MIFKRFFNTDSDVRSPEAKALIKGGYSLAIAAAIRDERKNINSQTGYSKGITVTRVGYHKAK